MATIRQANLLGQMRLDVPHLRAIESAVAADFDLLAGMILGGSAPLVVNGFKLTTSNAIGRPATALSVVVAGGTLMHYQSSESGTLFVAPATAAPETLSSTNPLVEGSFTSGQVNYVGLDLRREADASTTDVVNFLDPTTGSETPVSVPLGLTLSYRFYISTNDFTLTPNILPLAKVTVNSAGNVTEIQDARNLFFRLGSGGSFPDQSYSYPWPEGRRETTSTTGNNFVGGDKSITSLKGWMDAVMSTIWETKGGEFWYSPTADRNVKLMRDNTNVFANAENFSWDGTNLGWKGLSVAFDSANNGSVAPGVYYNEISDQTTSITGLTDLIEGQCLYVDLDRTNNNTLTAKKAYISTLNSTGAATPGSRYVLAWRIGSVVHTRDFPYPAGTTYTPATPTGLGHVRLSGNPHSVSSPTVGSINAEGNLSAQGISRDGAFAADGTTPLGAGTLEIGNGTDDTTVEVRATASSGGALRLGNDAASVSVDALDLTIGNLSPVEAVLNTNSLLAVSFRAATNPNTDFEFDTDQTRTNGAIFEVKNNGATRLSLSSAGRLLLLSGASLGLDTTGGGTLGVGTTTQTSLLLGRNGAPSSLLGNLLFLESQTTIGLKSNGSIDVGTLSPSGTVYLGRSATEQRAQGTLVADGALYVGTGGGAVSDADKVDKSVYAEISATSETLPITTGLATFVVLHTEGYSRNCSTTNAPTYSVLSSIPKGIYLVNFSGAAYVGYTAGTATKITLGVVTGPTTTPATGTNAGILIGKGSALSVNDHFNLSFTGVVYMNGTDTHMGVKIGSDNGAVTLEMSKSSLSITRIGAVA